MTHQIEGDMTLYSQLLFIKVVRNLKHFGLFVTWTLYINSYNISYKMINKGETADQDREGGFCLPPLCQVTGELLADFYWSTYSSGGGDMDVRIGVISV